MYALNTLLLVLMLGSTTCVLQLSVQNEKFKAMHPDISSVDTFQRAEWSTNLADVQPVARNFGTSW